jgi:hypothetical protein
MNAHQASLRCEEVAGEKDDEQTCLQRPSCIEGYCARVPRSENNCPVNAYQVSLTLTFHATDPLEAVQLMADHLNATPTFAGMCYGVRAIVPENSGCERCAGIAASRIRLGMVPVDCAEWHSNFHGVGA